VANVLCELEKKVHCGWGRGEFVDVNSVVQG
jgi:hypothetical protein